MRGIRRGRLMRMDAARCRRKGGAGGLRDLHDGHAMYTRGIHIGSTFLRVAGVQIGRGRRLNLVGLCFVRGYLGSLDSQILGSLVDLLDGISLIVRLSGIVCIAPLVFLCRRRRAGRG